MNDDPNPPVDSQFDLDRIGRECNVDQLTYKSQVDSTNDWAIEDAADDAIDRPRLLLAGHQIAGRGRGTNPWQASQGSLTFTLLLPCSWPINDDRRNLVPLATGVGVCKALGLMKFRPQIKWPNDIYLNDRKLGGILIESVAAGKLLAAGCGLNINNDLDGLPSAISLKQAAQVPVAMTSITISVVNEILAAIRQLQDGTGRIVTEYRKYDWLNGKRVEWNQADQHLEATVTGISSDGGLRLETGGQEQVVHTGSIRALEE